jgi:HAD superfamily hydrolase (TIGR01509 family)
LTGRALLIDLDGTLADSLDVMRTVYTRFLARFGLEGNDAEFDALNGPPTDEVVRMLQHARNLEGTHAVLLADYRSLVADAYARVSPSPGARTLLERAHAAGWSIAVVTSNGSAVARRWLDAAGLGELVDHVVGGDMVERGKPNPDPYVAALSALGADPARSVALEDSSQGAAAAQAAGVRTFLYRPGVTATAMPADGLAGVVGRVDEILELLE